MLWVIRRAYGYGVSVETLYHLPETEFGAMLFLVRLPYLVAQSIESAFKFVFGDIRPTTYVEHSIFPSCSKTLEPRLYSYYDAPEFRVVVIVLCLHLYVFMHQRYQFFVWM